MIFSKSCVYGLRAMIYLASISREDYVSIKGLSEKLDISFHFLTKILQQLTAADLLESMKGPKGGVRLSKPGSEITLKEVVEAIDGPAIFTECVLGLPGCGSEKPCPMHDMWQNTRDGINEVFMSTSLKDMSKEGKKKDLRITPDGKFIWG
ncbi:transcriptional regulator, BadM/Rrf2 family [Fodinibius salinus]|uniref:Transcriptional regulator, BadM/Rrf2 family n=1 Tax=Fodinibius salinus TaxID=860790 RepID=A0A5D3YLS4_9BACT|nr:Rrf2 family transcriptional regulator [Fodinibius salinus]TYP94787.1 transcriptional regulator, BadM/Rrf2 family [Fodinibius salinus]